KSYDNGNTWIYCSATTGYKILALNQSTAYLLNGSLLITYDGGSNWNNITPTSMINDIVLSDTTTLWAGGAHITLLYTPIGYEDIPYSQIFSSNDGGNTWILLRSCVTRFTYVKILTGNI